MDKSRRIDYRIRDFRPEDSESLFQLWKECEMAQPERGDTPETIERCNAQGGRLLVMEDWNGHHIVGSSWMTWDGRRVYLHHFGVLPDYRGKGLGTRLARASLDWIRKKGWQVKLEVHKNNDIAKRLYEKLGFFAFRDYDIYMIRDFT
jgi:ribosomal protein S18 acetylase RimI-like enzyme